MPLNDKGIVFCEFTVIDDFPFIHTTPLPTLDELNDIKTAVSEAVTNSIVHGYKDLIGTVYINIKITDESQVIITIKDRGCGIDNIQHAREPLFTTGASDRSGMGFTIMESFMDKISVTAKPGKGTTVKMQKSLKQKCELKKNEK